MYNLLISASAFRRWRYVEVVLRRGSPLHGAQKVARRRGVFPVSGFGALPRHHRRRAWQTWLCRRLHYPHAAPDRCLAPAVLHAMSYRRGRAQCRSLLWWLLRLGAFLTRLCLAATGPRASRDPCLQGDAVCRFGQPVDFRSGCASLPGRRALHGLVSGKPKAAPQAIGRQAGEGQGCGVGKQM